MIIPQRTKESDISSEVARGKHFEQFVKENALDIAERVGTEDSLNEEIARLAKKESLNRIQIQRLVEETNTQSFITRYKAVSDNRDRRVVYELADTKKILEYMGDDAPPAVTNPNFPNGFIESRPDEPISLNKVASEQIDFSKPLPTAEDLRYKEYLLQKEAKENSRLYKTCVNRIGNTLIHNERINKNANVILNTIIADAGLNKKATSDIIESANRGVNFLKEASRLPASFTLELSVDPIEKEASSLFGEYSLLEKTASDSYQTPKVTAGDYASTYEDILKIAKDLQSSLKKINQYTEGIK